MSRRATPGHTDRQMSTDEEHDVNVQDGDRPSMLSVSSTLYDRTATEGLDVNN